MRQKDIKTLRSKGQFPLREATLLWPSFFGKWSGRHFSNHISFWLTVSLLVVRGEGNLSPVSPNHYHTKSHVFCVRCSNWESGRLWGVSSRGAIKKTLNEWINEFISLYVVHFFVHFFVNSYLQFFAHLFFLIFFANLLVDLCAYLLIHLYANLIVHFFINLLF